MAVLRRLRQRNGPAPEVAAESQKVSLGFITRSSPRTLTWGGGRPPRRSGGTTEGGTGTH